MGGRCRIRVRSRWTQQVSDLVGLLDGRRGPRVRSQLRRQRRPGDRGAAPGPGRRRRRLRDAVVVARLVAGHDGRCRARSPRRAIRPTPPSGSCAGSSATRDGRSSRRRPVRHDGRRVRRWSASSSTCASTHRGAPTPIAAPVVAIYGERGAAHHRAGTEYLARELPDCHVVEVAEARHFGPNTHAAAVAAAIVDLASESATPTRR